VTFAQRCPPCRESKLHADNMSHTVSMEHDVNEEFIMY
jgi:hypothetical protein